jgi:hypothetical protein
MFKVGDMDSRSEGFTESRQLTRSGGGESTSKEESEKVLSEEDLETIANLNNTVLSLQNQGKYIEAEEMRR